MRITRKKQCIFNFLLLSFLLASTNIHAQITVKINTSNVIASDIKDKIGLNVNAGVDSDVDRGPGARSLTDALKETGIKRLRYPGGEKSNYFMFSCTSPTPDPTTFKWLGWYNGQQKTTLNFDEFMTLCQETNAEAHINVPVNIWYPTLDANLAAQWVKYANITKGYKVKYWEIGNEMWHENKVDSDASLKINFQTMVQLIKQYSGAMKAVDPSIKIGVSWHNDQMQALIDRCGSALDFITISNYTDGGGITYSGYKDSDNLNLLLVNTSLSLPTVISEYNYASWKDDEWDIINSTGKGLINFDLVGQMLLNPKVKYGCLWNTRWYDEAGTKWDAFNGLNEALPIIQPFILWRKFLNDKMVKVSVSNKAIVGYASFDSKSHDLNVFLINKTNDSQDVNIKIYSEHRYLNADTWQFKGDNEWDKNPTISHLGSTTTSENEVNCTLKGTSITVLKLTTCDTQFHRHL